MLQPFLTFTFQKTKVSSHQTEKEHNRTSTKHLFCVIYYAKPQGSEVATFVI